MRVSFPRFGYDTPAIKTFVEDLGAEVIMPPSNSRRTMEFGVEHSPELICLPYKITLGNMMEAAEKGAEVILMAAGTRKCRFGYYHYLQSKVIEKLYPHCRLVPIGQYSPPELIFKTLPDIFSVTPARVIKAICKLIAKSRLTMEFRRLLNHKMAVEFTQLANVEAAKKKALTIIDDAMTFNDINSARSKIRRIMHSDGTPTGYLRMGLVGEIYVASEQFANCDIEKELGKLGVEVIINGSFYHHIGCLLKVNINALKAYLIAHKYLRGAPGGGAMLSVGESMEYAREKLDGVIHVMPFGCMPESIAAQALRCVSNDYGIPVMSLSFDEHSGTAGMLTRLEAFVDMAKRSKRGTRNKLAGRCRAANGG